MKHLELSGTHSNQPFLLRSLAENLHVNGLEFPAIIAHYVSTVTERRSYTQLRISETSTEVLCVKVFEKKPCENTHI